MHSVNARPTGFRRGPVALVVAVFFSLVGQSPSADASENPNAASSQAEFSTGTGIILSTDGKVLTNHHVVDACQGIAVRNLDGAIDKAAVLFTDKANDLALIKIDARIAPENVAGLRKSPPIQGETIAVYGFPLIDTLSTDGNITGGNISALAGPGDDARFDQITAPIQPGNSGGPLLDASGNVVGVVQSKLDEIGFWANNGGKFPQNVNFAIKSSIAVNFLEAHHVEYVAASGVQKLDLPAIADIARRFTVLIVCASEPTVTASQPPAQQEQAPGGQAEQPQTSPQPPAPGPSFVTQSTIWDHNGSEMLFVQGEGTLLITYLRPKQSLLSSGVSENTLLFEGDRQDNAYTGTGYRFSRACGKRSYKLNGEMDHNRKRLILRGEVSRIDANCNPTSSYEDVLVFDYLRNDVPEATRPAQAIQAAQAYFRNSSLPNADALALVQPLLPEKMWYMGRWMTKSAVMSDKTDFAARWPERNYIAQPETITATCEPGGQCTVDGVVNWQAYSPERDTTSVGSATFHLVFASTNPPVIITEESTVLSRQTFKGRSATSQAPTRESYRVQGVARDGALALRSGPGTSFPVTVPIPPDGQSVDVLYCQTISGYGTKWCRASWRGFEGWVSACCLVGEWSGRRAN